MTDSHPLMALLLNQNSFVGQGIEVEAEIEPLPEQLIFGPGSVAILATASTTLERDFAILKGLDPEKHAETFPDWEERMLGVNNAGQGSFVLCEHFSAEDPLVTIGWFSRVKLMPISQDRYEETRGWIDDGFPPQVPQWVQDYYQTYTDALSERAPQRVPHTVECPECKGRNVELNVSRRVVYRGHAGVLRDKGKERYITLNDTDTTENHVAVLQCLDCHSTATLTDPEWDIPGVTTK